MLDPLVSHTHHPVRINCQTAPAGLPRRDGVPTTHCRRKPLTCCAAAQPLTKGSRCCSKTTQEMFKFKYSSTNIWGSTVTLRLAMLKLFSFLGFLMQEAQLFGKGVPIGSALHVSRCTLEKVLSCVHTTHSRGSTEITLCFSPVIWDGLKSCFKSSQTVLKDTY